MSLNQLPESSPATPRRSLLLVWRVAALSLALVACDKPASSETSSAGAVAAEVQKREVPSSVVESGKHSTTEERMLVITDIIRLMIGNQKREENTMYTHHFTPDTARADQWQLRQLDVGFGTNDGIHLILVRQEGETKQHWEMVDIFTKGDIAFSDNTTTAPTSPENGTPMMRVDTDRTVDAATQDTYGAALAQAKVILEAEVTNGQQ